MPGTRHNNEPGPRTVSAWRLARKKLTPAQKRIFDCLYDDDGVERVPRPSHERIAKLLGKAQQSVSVTYMRGIAAIEKKLPGYGVRACLGMDCGAWFWSHGAGNRLCPRCSGKAESKATCRHNGRLDGDRIWSPFDEAKAQGRLG